MHASELVTRQLQILLIDYFRGFVNIFKVINLYLEQKHNHFW